MKPEEILKINSYFLFIIFIIILVWLLLRIYSCYKEFKKIWWEHGWGQSVAKIERRHY